MMFFDVCAFFKLNKTLKTLKKHSFEKLSDSQKKVFFKQKIKY